jgi:hypothetical protein
LLTEALNEVPPYDAPSDLKTDIMNQIAAHKLHAPALPPSFRHRLMAFFEELRARFSYGLALGAVFGFVLCFALLTSREAGDIDLREKVVGSMVPSDRTTSPLTTSERIEGRDVSCSLGIATSDTTISLRVRISSREPVEVLLAYDPNCLMRDEKRGFGAGTSAISNRPGSLQLQHTGEQDLTIVLDRVESERSDALLELRTGTEVLWRVLSF